MPASKSSRCSKSPPRRSIPGSPTTSARSRKKLFDGQIVLVCDVGGGTSDFSLIRVSREGDLVNFTRTAVGKHLLLGGDNLDLTLAWLVESKLGVPLSIRQRSGLRRQCSAAKERLLNDPHLKSVEITVLGAGSSLIGKSLKTEILREEALELALEGFLPHERARRAAEGRKAQPVPRARPALRLRPGHHAPPQRIPRSRPARSPTPSSSTAASSFRRSCASAWPTWWATGTAAVPRSSRTRDLDLAVARGAAYYSYVRSTGSGVLVRGGLPRTYYIGLGEPREGKFPAVCLVPRGAEEGAALEIDNDALQLVANRPVSFRLYSSLTRTEDSSGTGGRIRCRRSRPAHARAAACRDPLRQEGRGAADSGEAGRAADRNRHARKLVRIARSATTAGACNSNCASTAKEAPAERKAAAVVSEQALKASLELIEAVFSPGAKSPIAARGSPGQARADHGAGQEQLAALRHPADGRRLPRRGRRPQEEPGATRSAGSISRGFCLRPGFGYPGDDFRIEQARRVYAAGLTYGNQVQCEIDWWIFWGRVAGGLNRNQQTDIYQRLSGFLLPRGARSRSA